MDQQVQINADFDRGVGKFEKEVKQNKEDQKVTIINLKTNINTVNNKVEQNKYTQEKIKAATSALIATINTTVKTNKQEQTKINTTQSATNSQAAADIELLMNAVFKDNFLSISGNEHISKYALYGHARLNQLKSVGRDFYWINDDNIQGRRIKYYMKILKGAEFETNGGAVYIGVGPILLKQPRNQSKMLYPRMWLQCPLSSKKESLHFNQIKPRQKATALLLDVSNHQLVPGMSTIEESQSATSEGRQQAMMQMNS